MPDNFFNVLESISLVWSCLFGIPPLKILEFDFAEGKSPMEVSGTIRPTQKSKLHT